VAGLGPRLRQPTGHTLGTRTSWPARTVRRASAGRPSRQAGGSSPPSSAAGSRARYQPGVASAERAVWRGTTLTGGTRGSPRESQGRLRQGEEHPASPHDLADPAAQKGPSGHSDPPSATKRPFGSERLPTRKQCRSEIGELVRLGTVSERPDRRKIQSNLAPSMQQFRTSIRAEVYAWLRTSAAIEGPARD